METVEISELDTRYEGLRLKNRKRERTLYMSIMEKGVLEPLYVIKETDNPPILLDGYKRLRIARRCKIHMVPISVLEKSTVPGILRFLRMTAAQGLTQVEQACLVDELHERHGLSANDIALQLGRSPAWISLRLDALREMGGMIREKVMAGHFPLHNYLYTLKRFKRLKSVTHEKMECFVDKVANKGLSTRDIDLLAGGYFKGQAVLKEQIDQGKIDWTLNHLKRQAKEKELPDDGLQDIEARVLSQLNWIFIGMSRLTHMLHDTHFENADFLTQGKQLVNKILSVQKGFFTSLEYFNDRA